MNLHGHARLDLLRDGKTVHRVEKHNTITPWIANAIGRGNFHDQISPSKIMPIKQWFEGCLLTDVPNDPELMMIAGNANITAQASNDAYSGSNQKRGTFNTTESGNIENGYRFIWDWATNQGNGDIASACLTRASIGAAEISEASTDPSALVNEFIVQRATVPSIFPSFNLIDYENERAYIISYSNSVITISEYGISSKSLHLFDEGENTLIASHTFEQTVWNFSNDWCSLSQDDGGKLHLFTWSGSRIDDYAFDLDNDTCTATTHTYSGVSFSQGVGIGCNTILKDGDYIYALSNNWTKIAKCNLSNDADATLIDMPIGLGSNQQNGTWIKLANGDFYLLCGEWNAQGNRNALYFHNGKVYNTLVYYDFGYSGGWTHTGRYSLSKYGTLLYWSQRADNPLIHINALFPYVSTVANLDASVRKTADLTMKLSYEITEV